MNINEIKEAIRVGIRSNDLTPIYITGAPGCGKTDLCLDIAVEYGIPRDVAKLCMFRPSFRDPVDLMGVPYVDDVDDERMTRWARNHFIWYVNAVAKKYGIAILIIDELAQGIPAMQNAMAGLMHDRMVGEQCLDDRVYIVATGNRVTDKAGSNRIVTQLGNRMEVQEMDVSMEQWIEYMQQDPNYDPLLLGFIQFRAGTPLTDFSPDRLTNATMRSWTAVSKIPTNIDGKIYYAKVAGRVGEGHAAEYIGFRKIAEDLPSLQAICADPADAVIPDQQSAKFATATMCRKYAAQDPKVFPAVAAYMKRVARTAPELEVVFYRGLEQAQPVIAQTPEYIDYITNRAIGVIL